MRTNDTTQFRVLALLLAISVVSGCLSDVPQGGSDVALDSGVGSGDTLNSAPTISGSPDRAAVIGSMYSFTPSASDSDGDNLTFSIRNQPNWVTFDPATGQLSGQAMLGNAGTYGNIVISVSDSEITSSLPAFVITVSQASPSNSAPTISGTPSSQVNANNAYDFIPTASDADGDTLRFSITGQPTWANFDTTTGRVSGTPSADDIGSNSNIIISVSDSEFTSSLPAFVITVSQTSPSNSAPTISGTPPSQVNVNTQYSFTPTASDADGDELTFSVGGLPGWASFSISNGNIAGTPSDINIGTYNDISITVSDGSASATLGPFSIAVVDDNANAAPTISGSPAAQVNANEPYSFTPTASDADGDELTFSVVGLPGWARFNTSSGALTGTPTDANVGMYSDIRISVSDGSTSASIGPFSITVNAISLGSTTLNLTPPTANDDGTALTDLAGYNIYYGQSEGNYPNRIRIDNPSITTYVVENLSPDTYYVVATSFNSDGIESRYSNVVVKTVTSN